MKFRLILKSFNKNLINNTLINLKTILLKADIKINNIISLPIKIKKFCVLRSPHIDKDSREHFEIRIYKKFIDFEMTSTIFIDTLLDLKILTGISCTLKIL